jgi:AraC family transcriptional regulator
VRFSELLFESPTVTVYQVACHARRGGDEGNEIQQTACIAFPLRGCYAVERGAQTTIADANTAIFFDPETVHRVSHPADGGDVSLVLAFDDATTADAFGGALPAASASVPGWLQLRLRILRDNAVRGDDPEAIEESTLAILGGITGSTPPVLSSIRRRAVERAKAFMGVHFRDRLLLKDIADAAKISPFALARAFPAATGMTPHQYLLALRHNAALDAIAAGEGDLMRLAIELGFAHHSHLSKTFSDAFGSTPSALRARLTGS